MSAVLKVVEKEGMENKNKALDAALAQIERAFGKGSIMKLGQREAVEIESISTGSLGLDIALGIGGLPKGRVVEIYGKLGQDHALAACHRRSPEEGRHLRLRRRRTRARPGLRQEAWRRYRQPPDLPARRRRAGPGDRRHPGALGRRRCAGDRFGGGPGAARR